MLDDLWFVTADGHWAGPFSASEMQARIADGRFAGALVWKPGWSDWQPIGQHFSVAQPEPQLEAAPDASVERPRAAPWLIAAIVIAATVAIVLGAILFGNSNFYRFGDAAPYLYGATWVGAILAVLVATVLTWRRAAVPGVGWPWQFAKSVGALALLGAFAFTVLFVRVNQTIYNATEARRTFGTYELTYDPVSRTIFFEGPIGPRFADRLNAIFVSNSGVRALHISNSPGGLIDEALQAAHYIERQPNLIVEASTECNSACFALFMAGQARRAEYLAEFGFHQTDMITDMPAFAREAVDGGGGEFRAYLIGRGLRADLYDGWTRSHDLYPVNAIDLHDLGLINEITNEGGVIDAASARWLWISTLSASTDNGFAELAGALADSGDDDILQLAKPIFVASRGGDPSAIQAAMAGLLPELLPRVLESADPAVAQRYLGASRASIDYLVSMEQWDACASVVDGGGLPDQTVPNSVVKVEMLALAEAVRSAAETGWVARPLPSWAESAGRQTINATIDEAARAGIDNRQYQTSPRVRCLLVHRMLGRVQGGDPTRSLVAYRWIAAN